MSATSQKSAPRPTACLALADGTVFFGQGFGATGETVAELVFNTAMTGYQEIMTDPSYAGQVVTFTFPHIGNVGVTTEDDEAADPVAAGLIVKWDPTEPSNWRSTSDLQAWLAAHELALQERQDMACTALPSAPAPAQAPAVPQGQFDAVTGAFGFAVGANQRPQRPWTQVLANPDFGSLLTESGGGYLRPLLKLLGIPESSQVLVFSKTSLQINNISPAAPRAVSGVGAIPMHVLMPVSKTPSKPCWASWALAMKSGPSRM